VHGETGFLVTPAKLRKLGDRLARLVSDRRLAAHLGANARDLAVERFTWRACAERCLAAYQELAWGRRGRRGSPCSGDDPLRRQAHHPGCRQCRRTRKGVDGR
jgi:hypothetical protein